MALQHQNIDDNLIEKSQVQPTQAGRDAVSFQNSNSNQVNIGDIYCQLFRNPKSAEVDWDRGMKSLEKQLPEIRRRLADTVGRDRILMDVSINENTNWVNRTPLAADENLQLFETFLRDDVKGKLLILGTPGAGKTTALLSLAEQLVDEAISQPETVIPVIFELSTWKNDQDIKEWLVERLYDHHKVDRRQNCYEQWLEQQVLLPLMDGLDELDLDRQTKCTEKLDEFASYYPHLVVCCRINQFETVGIKLRNLSGAVCIQPLSNSQIQNYLDTIKRPELWEAIQTNPSLQAMLEPTTDGDPGLLRVPLFVKLVADVYKQQQPISSKTDLLNQYINQQLSFDKRDFDRRKELEKSNWAYKTVNNEPDYEKARSHLRWMAQNLKANNEMDFLIEHLQPSSINPKLEKYYQPLFWLIFSIFTSLIVILALTIVGLTNQYVSNQINVITVLQEIFDLVVSSVLFVAILWFFREIVRHVRGGEKPSWFRTEAYKIDKIEAVEAFQFPSNENLFNPVRSKFLVKVLGAIVIILSIAWVSNVSICKYRIFSFILAATVLNCIIYGINLMKQELNPKNREKPNQGILNSFCNYIKLTILVIIIYVISVYFGSQLPSIFLPAGLIVSFLVCGGKAWLQHLSLRIVLWQSGLPWNLAQFLNYCVERRLLLRVGGSYRFLHRELLDHFV